MSIDIALARQLLDEYEVESSQAEAAKTELTTAQVNLDTAVTNYTRENDEAKAKLKELVTALQAALAD